MTISTYKAAARRLSQVTGIDESRCLTALVLSRGDVDLANRRLGIISYDACSVCYSKVDSVLSTSGKEISWCPTCGTLSVETQGMIKQHIPKRAQL